MPKRKAAQKEEPAAGKVELQTEGEPSTSGNEMSKVVYMG
jgi:hypothetical protein